MIFRGMAFSGFGHLRLRLFKSVEGDRFADERREGGRVNFFSLVDIDRTPYVSFEARVEKTGWIFKGRALGESQLYDLFVGFASANDPVVGPDGGAHPF